MIYGEFLVTGQRRYRGHEPGTRFEARLETGAMQRAIRRGDIAYLRETTPSIEGPYSFPEGWLSGPASPDHRGASRRLTH